jgi:hypothetical protein
LSRKRHIGLAEREIPVPVYGYYVFPSVPGFPTAADPAEIDNIFIHYGGASWHKHGIYILRERHVIFYGLQAYESIGG